MALNENGLTEKQQLFADKYIATLNATQSAIYAGYSEKTAEVIGHENLRKPKIDNYIQKALNERKSNLIASQEEILETYTKIVRDENETTGNRLKALDSLGKTYAMFTDRVHNEVKFDNGKLNDLQKALSDWTPDDV